MRHRKDLVLKNFLSWRDDELIGFVITGHGSFASGILESVQFIAGRVEQIRVVSFQEDQEKLYKDLKQAISEVDTGSGAVCFADLADGTPFNVCSRIALTRKMYV